MGTNGKGLPQTDNGIESEAVNFASPMARAQLKAALADAAEAGDPQAVEIQAALDTQAAIDAAQVEASEHTITDDAGLPLMTVKPLPPNSKGFFRRQRIMIDYFEKWRSGRYTSADQQRIIDFILGFVVYPDVSTPKAREAVTEIILDLSETDVLGMIGVLIRGGAEYSIPLPKGD